MRRSAQPLAVATLLGLACLPAAVSACTCVGPPSTQAALAGADLVFTGIAEWVDDPKPRFDPELGTSVISGADRVAYLFRVIAVWKGEPQAYLRVESARSSATCGYEFKEGATYLVYAHEYQGTMRTGLCTGTTPIERAGAALMTLPDPIYVSPGASSKRPTIEDQIHALRSADPQMQVAALNTLQELGPRAASAVPAVLQLIDRAGAEAAYAIPWALVRMAPDSEELTLRMAAAARDTSVDGSVRAQLLATLWRTKGSAFAGGIPPAQATRDLAMAVRRAAYAQLVSEDLVGARDVRAKVVDQALHDPAVEIRRGILEHVERDVDPGSLLPLLITALEDTAAAVREVAVRRLHKMPGERVSLLLSRLLRDDSEMVRRIAFQDLCQRVEDGTAPRELLCPARANDSTWFRNRLKRMPWLWRYPCKG